MRRGPAGAVLLAAVLVCAVPLPASSADSAVIIQYHHFGSETPSSTSVTVDEFRSHLEYLQEGGFTVWPVERIIASLRRGEPLPDRCVGITIDDGYASVYERALPLLRERAFPFTVFVTTAGVDAGHRGYMTWEQMRGMLSQGATLGAHGHSHDYLIRRRAGESEAEWTERVKKDIALSVRRLKEETGIEPHLFAYPFGEYDAALKGIVVDLGLIAFAQHSGPVWRGSDMAALPRFPMAAGYADMRQFALKAESLPLPVVSALPDDPVLPLAGPPPLLRLELAPGDYDRETLACYGPAGRSIEASWEGREGQTLGVVSREPLPAGRSKYTCTARHQSQNRYFWYSHLWIKGGSLR